MMKFNNLKNYTDMTKHYQIPTTSVVLLKATDLMQLSVASGSLNSGTIGNAPGRKGEIF